MSRPANRSWLCLLLPVVALLLGARPAAAQDEAGRVAKLNKQALEAFDNLNFEQAKTFLEQALSAIESAGLANDPAAARTHLNMGLVLMGGFQQRDAAAEHFKAALKIQPDVAPPRGLFNPEVQAVFDETKKEMKPEATKTEPVTPPPVKPKPKVKTPDGGDGDGDGDGDGEDDQAEGEAKAAAVQLAIGVGSGAGATNAVSDTNARPKSGLGVGRSQLLHFKVEGGYFVSRDLLLSLEGRVQLVSGTTTYCPVDPEMPDAMLPCITPSTIAIAVLAKATYFFSSGPLRPFVTGGAGGGRIRQVLKLQDMDCGMLRNQACTDSVSGGPVWVLAAGGVSFETGPVVLLGSLGVNAGLPNFMLNLDLTVGMGFRL